MAFIHKHTKGNWAVTGLSLGVVSGIGVEVKTDEDEYTDQFLFLNEFAHLFGRIDDNIEANFQLISQAPKLLELVEMYHDHLISCNENSMVLGLIKQTLEKAGVEIQDTNNNQSDKYESERKK